ncbi:MAG: hypothetical protein AAB877_00845 [Patescibacteria group bacterium]
MQITDLPVALFDRIVEITRVSKIWPLLLLNKYTMKIIFIKKAKMAIGLVINGTNEEAFSCLKVWNFSFTSNFQPADFWNSDIFYKPFLEITAGCICQEKECDPWLGPGQNITKAVRVGYSGGNNALVFALDDPFIALKTRIIVEAAKIQRKYNLVDFHYWRREAPLNEVMQVE